VRAGLRLVLDAEPDLEVVAEAGEIDATRRMVAGMGEFGFWPVVQRIDIVGLAALVLLAGAGRWSADYELRRTADPSPEAQAQAVGR
jgi:hypothetical protein